MSAKLKLNLGCGNNHMVGYVNVDNQPQCHPDVCLDLENDHWPWPIESVCEIQACHVMEHLSHRGFIRVMVKAYRVLCPGGFFGIAVPHPRSDFFINDPTHITPITDQTLHLFSAANCADFKANGKANTPLATHYNVDFRLVDVQYAIADPWKHLTGPDADNDAARKELAFAMTHFFNVISESKFLLERV